MSDLLDRVLAKVRPTSQERKRIEEVAEAVLSKIEELAGAKGVECKVMMVGSAARNTWLAGDHDLDIFIGVPVGSDLNVALNLAREVAPHHEERYAEHAYVHARVGGFELDMVPCYLVENATQIMSAVDRTPFHNRYVSSRIGGMEDEVLLLKQFMKGVNVYGSELKVGGFSGYLAEILIIRYRSFLGVLEGACLWHPGEVIDLEGHSALAHRDPLVVTDPVDPRRNVAAALSLDNMFRFAAAARSFLNLPLMEYFFPHPAEPLTDEELIGWLKRRKSTIILAEFRAPDQVEDVIFPQLRKAEQAVLNLFERNDFSTLRSDVDLHGDVSDGTGLVRMVFELEVGRLPEVRKHVGPFIWDAKNVERFVSRHPEPISGPYVEDGRAVVEVARKYTTAIQLLKSQMTGLSMGKHLSQEMQRGYKIYLGRELVQVRDEEFRRFLARYFSAREEICRSPQEKQSQ